VGARVGLRRRETGELDELVGSQGLEVLLPVALFEEDFAGQYGVPLLVLARLQRGLGLDLPALCTRRPERFLGLPVRGLLELRAALLHVVVESAERARVGGQGGDRGLGAAG